MAALYCALTRKKRSARGWYCCITSLMVKKLQNRRTCKLCESQAGLGGPLEVAFASNVGFELCPSDWTGPVDAPQVRRSSRLDRRQVREGGLLSQRLGHLLALNCIKRPTQSLKVTELLTSAGCAIDVGSSGSQVKSVRVVFLD